MQSPLFDAVSPLPIEDWQQLRTFFLSDGLFWLKEFALVGAVLFCLSTLVRKRSILCWVSWHHWRTLRTNHQRAIARAGLHELAGTLSRCRRCGEVFDDLGGFTATDALGNETIVDLAEYRSVVEIAHRVQLEGEGWIPPERYVSDRIAIQAEVARSTRAPVRAAPKKKSAPKKPRAKKEKPKKLDRFDRILELEGPTSKADPKPAPPADTNTPPSPSQLED